MRQPSEAHERPRSDLRLRSFDRGTAPAQRVQPYRRHRVDGGRLARSSMYHFSVSTIAGFSPLA